jgi:EamA domain-containing membrane protein RarD
VLWLISLLMSAAIALIALDDVIEQVLPIAGIFIGACFTAYILWHRHKALAPITALKRETTLLFPIPVYFAYCRYICCGGLI